MLAVVLVGGFGTRMRPLTDEVPKPMLPIVHRPMIVRLIERLGQAGVTDVVLALGFRPEPFASAFPDDRLGDVRVHYAVEPEPLDTAGAIAFAARSFGIDSTFVVANGDIITDLDVGELLAAHRELACDATIHLTPVEDPSAFGVVEADERGVVQRFIEKPALGETNSNLINAGTYIFEPAVLDLIAADERISVERDTFPKLVAAQRLGAFATNDYWIDAGRPELFLQANLDLISGVRTTTEVGVAPESHVDREASVTNSVIDADASVGARAVVVDSVLLAGAVVAEGARVNRSIVAGNVGVGAALHDCVVGRGYRVQGGAAHTAERLPSHS
jgi:mannose-1-phosphate guanylyltransferase